MVTFPPLTLPNWLPRWRHRRHDSLGRKRKHASGRHGDAPVNATAAPKRLPQGMPARVPASGAMEKESDAKNAAREGLLD